MSAVIIGITPPSALRARIQTPLATPVAGNLYRLLDQPPPPRTMSRGGRV